MESTKSARGRLLIASCRSGAPLASQVVKRYEEGTGAGNGAGYGGVLYLPDIDKSFSDTETSVGLNIDVNGFDVFLFQALYDPTSNRSVDQNYAAFLMSVRTLKEWGAAHVTGVLPYLAYARQDKPTTGRREPTTAKLMADFTTEAGAERLITFHPHLPQIRGFYGRIPVNILDSMPLWIEAFARFEGREDVVAVAPDAGASKFVTYFARSLNLHSAIAAKFRPKPEEAVIAEVIGDLEHKRCAIIIDDMISSGGTVYQLARKLIEDHGIDEIYVGAAHNLCMEKARERLLELYEQGYLRAVITTDSIPQSQSFRDLPFVQVRSLSEKFYRAIRNIHHNRSLEEPILQQV